LVVRKKSGRGKKALVFQPQSEKAFTVRLEGGKYRAEWFQPETSKVEKAGVVESKGGEQRFLAPFKGPAVLYLTVPPDRQERKEKR
jgi:hypothetical protein